MSNYVGHFCVAVPSLDAIDNVESGKEGVLAEEAVVG
jgi:hypothetical protein